MNRKPDRFKHSRLQLWVFGGFGCFICILSMVMFKEAAVPIVSAAVPSMFALALGQTLITNYAEAKNPSYYFDDLPTHQPHQTVFEPPIHPSGGAP